MQIGSLTVKLALKGIGEFRKKLSSIRQGITVLSKKFLKISAIITGIIYLFKKLTGGFSAHAQSLDDMEELYGLSAKRIQQWEHAGKKQL